MTKILFSLFAFLISSVALAYPSIGDYAMLKGKIDQGGFFSDVTLESSIMDFDPELDVYVVVETQTIDGQAQTATNVELSENMITQKKVKEILHSCAIYGGMSETITVPAGTFATCKLATKNENDQQDGMVWIGDVSFGIVKAVGFKPGADYVVELESFRSTR